MGVQRGGTSQRLEVDRRDVVVGYGPHDGLEAPPDGPVGGTQRVFVGGRRRPAVVGVGGARTGVIGEYGPGGHREPVIAGGGDDVAERILRPGTRVDGRVDRRRVDPVGVGGEEGRGKK